MSEMRIFFTGVVIIFLSPMITMAQVRFEGSRARGNVRTAEGRLGLLATQLGVQPVPGASKDEFDVQGVTLIGPNGPSPSVGEQRGQCRCTERDYCQAPNYSGGNIPIIGNNPNQNNLPVIGGGPPNEGLNSGFANGPGGGSNPATTGSGVINVRIVNRPPIQCSPSQVYCCPGNEQQYPGPGAGSPGPGYASCGSRTIIDVPDWKPEYGQAKFGAYPCMSVILGKENNYVGAGALISPYYVVTAAHKVSFWKPGTGLKIRFGEWNAADDNEPYKNIEIDVDRVEIHPQFNEESLANDIALIRLSQPVDLNAYPHIKAACLPEEGRKFDGQRCWVAGFGKDAFGGGKHQFIEREVDLPIIESNDCENRLRTTRLGKYFELDRKSFICAGGEEGKDACTGDGGAPLVCENNGRWMLTGLVAWGIGCAEYGIPGVYVNVPAYSKWIQNKIYN